jgi:hypothetical protein
MGFVQDNEAQQVSSGSPRKSRSPKCDVTAARVPPHVYSRGTKQILEAITLLSQKGRLETTSFIMSYYTIQGILSLTTTRLTSLISNFGEGRTSLVSLKDGVCILSWRRGGQEKSRLTLVWYLSLTSCACSSSETSDDGKLCCILEENLSVSEVEDRYDNNPTRDIQTSPWSDVP